MLSSRDHSQSGSTGVESVRIAAEPSDIVQQLRQRIGKQPIPSTRASRVPARPDSAVYQSVLTRLVGITSGVDAGISQPLTPNEVSAAHEFIVSRISEVEDTHRDSRSETRRDATHDARHVGQLSHLQSALNDNRESAARLQRQVQSLEAESSILASRLGAENDARLRAEIEAHQLAADMAKLRDETAQRTDAWQRRQSLEGQQVAALVAENAQVKLALDEKNRELSEVRQEYDGRISQAAQREAQHAELRRSLEQRLDRLGSELATQRAASESVGREMQQLADEYARQMSTLSHERNQLRTQCDELKKEHDQSRQRCAELERRIADVTKSQRETSRENESRAMQVERLKVLLNETLAAQQDTKNLRAAELSQLTQSKARWKLLLTQARQKLREHQDQAQALIAKHAEEQSRRERAESNVARCQVTIELLNSRISSLKALMQREVAAVRKREAALKRVVQDRIGNDEVRRILSDVETDERVRRLSHELNLTRRLVLGLQQKCVEHDAAQSAGSSSNQDSRSKAA